MTDIEQKALALVNEEAGYDYIHARDMADKSYEIKALCRAIEQHEAFRQEVNDAVENLLGEYPSNNLRRHLHQFIIRKPDPLAEVIKEWWNMDIRENDAETLRELLEARGLEIREKGR